jgi:hypothetical protein
VVDYTALPGSSCCLVVAERRSEFGSSRRRSCPGRRRSYAGLDAGCCCDEIPVDRCVEETLPEVVFVLRFVSAHVRSYTPLVVDRFRYLILSFDRSL